MTKLIFFGNNVKYVNFTTNGIPLISIAIGGECKIGKNLKLNNSSKGNIIGCYQRCTFFVDKGSKLTIGENVGISQSAIICINSISIGNNVKIGGGCYLYDSDFHALNFEYRNNSMLDKMHRISLPINIEDNVFIGAHTIILKGVTIGKGSIIGAGSIVTKNIPINEIWAGNPAKYIKSLNR